MSPDVLARAGRPRSPQADQAIEAAALDLLVEQGYARLSIEGVAARAGVGKTTIYRRWDSKLELVLDAVVHRCAEHIVSPDTGDVRQDMRLMFEALLAKFRRDGPIMQAFIAEQSRHPELGEAFREMFLNDRRQATRDILARGVARGQLPKDTDIELLGDVGSAIIWHRLTVSKAPLTDDLPERIVRQLLPS